MRRYVAMCAISLAISPAADIVGVAAEVDVYVLTGQSNSLGTTGDTTNPDQSPGSLQADAATRFFWDNTAGDPPTAGWNSEGEILPLQPQQGGIFPNFNAPGLQLSHWGPEFGFARRMYAAGQRDVMIIKGSRGGGGNTHWSKSAGGLMYTHLRNTVESAAAEILAHGDTFEIRGLLYLQGESDDAGEAAMAGVRLSALAANLRADLPHADDMFTVIAGIASATAHDDLVRAQHSAVAASDPQTDYFGNLDLQPQLYDGLHFDKPAKLAVGERFALSVLNRIDPPNGISGDVNQDGVVSGDGTGAPEQDDVAAFLLGWRSVTVSFTNRERVQSGDLDLSGATDLADAFILHQALAAQGGQFPFTLLANIPEPVSLPVLLLALGPVVRLRRGHQRRG